VKAKRSEIIASTTLSREQDRLLRRFEKERDMSRSKIIREAIEKLVARDVRKGELELEAT
jgi:ribbon-helix-helix CopG family protein